MPTYNDLVSEEHVATRLGEKPIQSVTERSNGVMRKSTKSSSSQNTIKKLRNGSNDSTDEDDKGGTSSLGTKSFTSGDSLSGPSGRNGAGEIGSYGRQHQQHQQQHHHRQRRHETHHDMESRSATKQSQSGPSGRKGAGETGSYGRQREQHHHKRHHETHHDVESRSGTMQSHQKDGVTIVVTEPLRATMRSVSILSMGDPLGPPPRIQEESRTTRAGQPAHARRGNGTGYRNKTSSQKGNNDGSNHFNESTIRHDDERGTVMNKMENSAVSGTKSHKCRNLRRHHGSSARTSKLGSYRYDPHQHRHQQQEDHHHQLEAEFESESPRDDDDDDDDDDGFSILVSDTAHLRMRKVSILSMGDPAEPSRQHRQANPKPKRTSDASRERVACHNDRKNDGSKSFDQNESISRTEHSTAEDERHSTMTNLVRTTISTSSDDKGSNMTSNESTKSKDRSLPPLPTLVASKLTKCDLGTGVVSQESELRERAGSRDDCKDEVGMDKPAHVHQLKICKGEESNSCQDDDLDGTRHITTNGTEVGGVIVATMRQRQLMRAVSGLGLEDPVFGNIHDELNPRHASNIFADMDFADVPEDMRDLLSLASDRTDAVGIDDHILEESSVPPSKSDEVKATAPRMISTIKSMEVNNLTSAPLPLLGLDHRQTPTNEKSIPPSSGGRSSRKICSTKPPSHPSNQHGRILKRLQSPMPTIPSENDSIQQSHSPMTPNSQFTPSVGSFRYKKASMRRTNPTSPASALHFDEALAAQIDAMFQSPTTSVNTTTSTGKPNASSTVSSSNDSFNTHGSKTDNVGNPSIRRNQRGNLPILPRQWSGKFYVPHGPPGRESTVGSTTLGATCNSSTSNNSSSSINNNDDDVKPITTKGNSSQWMGEVTQRTLPSVESIFPGGSDGDTGQQHRDDDGEMILPPTSTKYGKKWKSFR